MSFAIILPHALVAQLDRVLVSEAKGRGFDSRRARQLVGSGYLLLFNSAHFYFYLLCDFSLAIYKLP